MSNRYINPIERPETVNIPKWEYRELVAKATTLEIARAVLEKGDKYKACDILEAVFADDAKEGE